MNQIYSCTLVSCLCTIVNVQFWARDMVKMGKIWLIVAFILKKNCMFTKQNMNSDVHDKLQFVWQILDLIDGRVR